MAECETRTQGVLVAGGYGRDGGRRIAPASAAGRPVRHLDSSSKGLTGILLVGGASSRFGSPKELAEYDGETLGDRAWRLLGEVCHERIAVGKRGDGLELSFPLLDDGTEVRAPLAGLVAGLRAAEHDVAVVIPVDMPLLDAASLRALAAACRDAAVPQSGPLPGAYRKSALPVLEEALAAGSLKLRDAVTQLDAASITLPEEVLANVNDRDDLQRLG